MVGHHCLRPQTTPPAATTTALADHHPESYLLLTYHKQFFPFLCVPFQGLFTAAVQQVVLVKLDRAPFFD